MDTSAALEIAQQGMQVAIMVLLPILAVSLFLGLAVSVFQAMTQIQEMTLTFVPKMAGAVIVLLLMGSWMLQQLVGFTIFCLQHSIRVAG
jgi:flagellar biosynthetic protein FliQ